MLAQSMLPEPASPRPLAGSAVAVHVGWAGLVTKIQNFAVSGDSMPQGCPAQSEYPS